MSKPKQKSVTMWAILNPYYNELSDKSVAATRKDAQIKAGYLFQDNWKNLYTEGYRAVKGKFVFEEK